MKNLREGEVFESLLKARNNSITVDKTVESFNSNYQTIFQPEMFVSPGQTKPC